MVELPTDTEPVRVVQGDCLDVLRELPDGCVDAVVTDPPYGLEFMGKEWDSFRGEAWRAGAGFSQPGIGDRKTPWPSFGSGDSANATCETCGGRMRGANKCGCETPDWRVKGKPLEYRNGRVEQMRSFQEWNTAWASTLFPVLKPGGYALIFGGTRTYHRLACAVEDAGFEVRDCLNWLYGTGFPKGQGCLKPAWEPILLARRPGKRVLPLGIDECRVPVGETDLAEMTGRSGRPTANKIYNPGIGANQDGIWEPQPSGRYPANVLHDGSDEVLAAFAAFGERTSGKQAPGGHVRNSPKMLSVYRTFTGRRCEGDVLYGDSGSAARFYYCAKASKADRGEGNTHPTVKPTELMRWLVRLVARPGGLVLDPFGGSGSTGVACRLEGRRCICIEKEPAYVAIAQRRVDEALARTGLFAGVE